MKFQLNKKHNNSKYAHHAYYVPGADLSIFTYINSFTAHNNPLR